MLWRRQGTRGAGGRLCLKWCVLKTVRSRVNDTCDFDDWCVGKCMFFECEADIAMLILLCYGLLDCGLARR